MRNEGYDPYNHVGRQVVRDFLIDLAAWLALWDELPNQPTHEASELSMDLAGRKL